jgi:hypothetical protein
MYRSFLFVALCAFFVVCPISAARHRPQPSPHQEGGPDVRFDGGDVVAAGVTSGTDVYFAALSLTAADYSIHLERSFGAMHAAANGDVRLTPETPLRERSVWIVADAASGDFTIAAPDGFLLRQLDFAEHTFDHPSTGLLKHLDLDHSHVEMFLIRPGSGIWRGSARDGAAGDDDAEQNGRIQLGLGTLAPLSGTASAPDHMQGGDVVVLIDQITLEYWAAKVGKQ